MSKKHRLKAAELLALTCEDGYLFHDAKGKPVELPQPAAPLADTHGHLTHFRQHNPAEALARASLAGVGLLGVPVDPVGDARDPRWLLSALDAWIENAHTCIDELRSWGVQPCLENPYELLDHVHLWVGVHPYGAAEFNQSKAAHKALHELLSCSRTVGIGEFGLDYGPYNQVDPKEQMQAFREQLLLAHELDLPVELHIRDADGDAEASAHKNAAQLLEELGVPKAGCDLHCYTSDARVMEPFVELGCYVAFGGAATFPRSQDIREAASLCPSHLLLSETDSPYMAPMPLRGMECEPAMVSFSADLLATVREECGSGTRDETYRSLWANAHRLFGLEA
ncbi:MAG: TatD family hydrolase [Atopobiaceae bacterium]|nr:TatD family hydrolase [Atopobiaceae bacterium]